MKTNADVRDEIIRQIVKAYREVRRIERLLAKPKMSRVFKNPKCKSAVAQTAMREALELGLLDAQCELVCIYEMLPEIGVGQYAAAAAFAAKCAKKPRTPKYLKGQLLLVQ